MIINHNIAALNTYRQLSSNQTLGNKSLEKLSAGLRINRAGDDAAGLAISEKMRGQIRGLNQANSNAQDAISLIQTAEGSLNETHEILQRMRELAVQAANDTNTKVDRGEIQKEINALTTEINRIGNTTQFNSMDLLDGSASVGEAKNAYAQSVVELGEITNITGGVGTKAVSEVIALNQNDKVDIRDAATPASVTGKVLEIGGSDKITIGDNNDTLVIEIGGRAEVITLEKKEYAAGADLATEIGEQIDAAFGTGVATVSFDGTGKKLSITTAETGSTASIKITGGDAKGDLFGVDNEITTISGQDANNELSFTVGDTKVAVEFTAGENDLTAIKNAINAAINNSVVAGKIEVSVTGGDKQLTIASKEPGTAYNIGNFAGAAAETLGLANASFTDGQDANNKFTMKIDGNNDVQITLAGGDYGREELAAALQSAIGQGVTVEVTDGNVLKITSGTEGAQGNIQINASAEAAALGLTVNAQTDNKGVAGADAVENDMQFQIGANHGQLMSINIDDMRADALNVAGYAGVAQGIISGAVFTEINTVSNGTETENLEAALDISDVGKATAAIEVIDMAIQKVSAERSKIGGYQNRLEHTINNLGTSAENLTAAESRVRDVDMAKEMMEFTKMNILQQAATAMLAQANQQPQQVLQLLR